MGFLRLDELSVVIVVGFDQQSDRFYMMVVENPQLWSGRFAHMTPVNQQTSHAMTILRQTFGPYGCVWKTL
jgi:hypothetical protein